MDCGILNGNCEGEKSAHRFTVRGAENLSAVGNIAPDGDVQNGVAVKVLGKPALVPLHVHTGDHDPGLPDVGGVDCHGGLFPVVHEIQV